MRRKETIIEFNVQFKNILVLFKKFISMTINLWYTNIKTREFDSLKKVKDKS